MKTTLAILTILVAVCCCRTSVAQQGYYGTGDSNPQYVWVPVVETISDDEGIDVVDYDEADYVDESEFSRAVSDTLGDTIVDSPQKFGVSQKHGAAQKLRPTQKHGKGGKSRSKGPAHKGKGKGKGKFGSGSRFFAGVEYTHAYAQGRQLPPIVTNGLPITNPAVDILFGGEEVGQDLQAGVRLTGGYWLDNSYSRALTIRAFGMEGDRTNFAATSPGAPALGIPFNNTGVTPLVGENVAVIATAGQTGSILAQAHNDVTAIDAFYRMSVDGGASYRIDGLAGYQFSRIDDDFFLATDDTRAAPFRRRTAFDLFDADNEYHAAQFGVLAELFQGPTTIQLLGKIGVGNMKQRVAISGGNTVTTVGTVTDVGGIFAQSPPAPGNPPFNIGLHERNEFVWSPEFSLKLSYEAHQNLKVTVGYTILYWSGVALAADHIDRNVNADILFNGPFLPGGSGDPTFTFNDSDFWVQTIDIGAIWNY